MAYNVAGLSAQGPAARTRPLPDSSHLGRQTAGENNPRLTPFDCLLLLLPKSDYVAAFAKVPFTIFLPPGHARIIGRQPTRAGSN